MFNRNIRYSTYHRSKGTLGVVCGITLLAATSASAQWTRWGGPTGDFKCSVSGLADKWPEGGPKKDWSRPLGDGYSSILVDGDRLYTAFSRDLHTVIACLKADNGETEWEYDYETNLPPDSVMNRGFGVGPRGTPLIVGDRLFVADIAGMLTCVNKSDGKKIWSHDFQEEYKAKLPYFGYSSSPVQYKDTIIIPVGGPEGKSIMAFDQATGSVAWSRHDFGNGYATPAMITVDGQEQVVAFMGKEAVGLNPENGDLYWTHPHETQYDVNATTPLYGDDGILLLSSAYETGSRAIKLTRNGDKTDVEELWASRKMAVHFGNVIRIDDHVYASSGGNGPVFLTAFNVKTGERAWAERDWVKVSGILADGKLILLDEDGKLILTRVSPDGVTVLSQHQLLENQAWTVPTLVGKKLYIRDRKNIMALDLG